METYPKDILGYEGQMEKVVNAVGSSNQITYDFILECGNEFLKQAEKDMECGRTKLAVKLYHLANFIVESEFFSKVALLQISRDRTCRIFHFKMIAKEVCGLNYNATAKFFDLLADYYMNASKDDKIHSERVISNLRDVSALIREIKYMLMDIAALCDRQMKIKRV